MPDDLAARLSRRALLGAVACTTLWSAPFLGLARAQDPAGALRDLADSNDFRVRLSAALYLARTKPAGAREALEHALGDAHSAVRVAVAAALGSLGDPAAVGALGRRLATEPSASVRAQIQASVDLLRRGVAAEQPPADATAQRSLGPAVRYVVKLGAMRNPSGVRGDDLRRVLREAVLNRASGLKGAAVSDGDTIMLAQAAARHLPIITLDGAINQLSEAQVSGSLQVQARVEFTVRRDQTLKGTLSGAATTFGSTPTLTDVSRKRLEDDAVDGAVQSALRGADQGLIVAAL